MYSDFVFLDRFLFELSCKHTHTHTDSNEYPIVAFSKNATIIMPFKPKIHKKMWCEYILVYFLHEICNVMYINLVVTNSKLKTVYN